MRPLRSIPAIMVMIFFIACRHDKKKLTILFNRVDNVQEESAVYMNGLPIGQVSRLALADRGVWVDIKLTDDVKIPADSKFFIVSSLLSPAHVTIEPSAKTIYLSPKDTVPGFYMQKGILDDLLSDSATREKAYEFLDKLDKRLKDIVKEAKDSTAQTK